MMSTSSGWARAGAEVSSDMVLEVANAHPAGKQPRVWRVAQPVVAMELTLSPSSSPFRYPLILPSLYVPPS